MEGDADDGDPAGYAVADVAATDESPIPIARGDASNCGAASFSQAVWREALTGNEQLNERRRSPGCPPHSVSAKNHLRSGDAGTGAPTHTLSGRVNAADTGVVGGGPSDAVFSSDEDTPSQSERQREVEQWLQYVWGVERVAKSLYSVVNGARRSASSANAWEDDGPLINFSPLAGRARSESAQVAAESSRQLVSAYEANRTSSLRQHADFKHVKWGENDLCNFDIDTDDLFMRYPALQDYYSALLDRSFLPNMDEIGKTLSQTVAGYSQYLSGLSPAERISLPFVFRFTAEAAAKARAAASSTATSAAASAAAGKARLSSAAIWQSAPRGGTAHPPPAQLRRSAAGELAVPKIVQEALDYAVVLSKSAEKMFSSLVLPSCPRRADGWTPPRPEAYRCAKRRHPRSPFMDTPAAFQLPRLSVAGPGLGGEESQRSRDNILREGEGARHTLSRGRLEEKFATTGTPDTGARTTASGGCGAAARVRSEEPLKRRRRRRRNILPRHRDDRMPPDFLQTPPAQLGGPLGSLSETREVPLLSGARLIENAKAVLGAILRICVCIRRSRPRRRK